MNKTIPSSLLILLCTAFCLIISTSFATLKSQEHFTHQNDSINKNLLTNKWWTPNHKMNRVRLLPQYFDQNGLLKMKLNSIPWGWKWKENENTIRVTGVTSFEYKVLKLAQDEFIFEYDGNVYHMFVK